MTVAWTIILELPGCAVDLTYMLQNSSCIVAEILEACIYEVLRLRLDMSYHSKFLTDKKAIRHLRINWLNRCRLVSSDCEQ